MNAAIYQKYGSPEVVEIKEIPKPEPKDNEILIKIYATTVSSADWRIRSLNVPAGFGFLVRLAFGIRHPRKQVLGTELSGVVTKVGKNVSKFKLGDEVFAHPGAQLGAHAEYIVMRENAPIAIKPANLSFEEAAALSFGGTTALDFLRNKGKIKKRDKVLINGASGAVGSAAVQIAKHFGAEVTGVCSTRNLEMVKSIGADQVIDYTQEEVTNNHNHNRYDIIMDTVGNLSWQLVKPSLTKSGRFLMIVAGFVDTFRAPLISRSKGKKAISGTARERAEDLQFLAELAESGKFKPVIGRSYSLEQIVEAHHHVDTGHKRGSVVITLTTPNLSSA